MNPRRTHQSGRGCHWKTLATTAWAAFLDVRARARGLAQSPTPTGSWRYVYILAEMWFLYAARDDEVGAVRTLRAITLENLLSGGLEIPESYDTLLEEA